MNLVDNVYKQLDKDMYIQFKSFIEKNINEELSKKGIRYDYLYIEDYIDNQSLHIVPGLKIYYSCICISGFERDIFPIYSCELDDYFDKFKAVYRDYRINQILD